MSVIGYLDVCCFTRPFDDATEDRVRREAEAVAAVLDAATRGSIRLVRSPAHDLENDRNPREDRRLATQLWLAAAGVRVEASQRSADRARELAALEFGRWSDRPAPDSARRPTLRMPEYGTALGGSQRSRLRVGPPTGAVSGPKRVNHTWRSETVRVRGSPPRAGQRSGVP